MPNERHAFVRIQSVNDGVTPVIVQTAEMGAFQLQQRIPKIEQQKLVKDLSIYEGSIEPCAISYHQHGPGSDNRRVLLRLIAED